MKTFWYRLTWFVKVAVCVLGAVAVAPSAWAQAVSLAELEGANIDVGAVHHERIIKNGALREFELRETGHLTIGAGGTVTTQFQIVSVGPRGERPGATRGGTQTIGKPGKDKQGNDVVWVFANGTLTRLRVFHAGGAGGQKMTFAFKRGPDGLRCSFSMPFARENGVGEISRDAAFDDTPIKILEFKTVSTSCSVAKR
jgi:hypothetical protein